MGKVLSVHRILALIVLVIVALGCREEAGRDTTEKEQVAPEVIWWPYNETESLVENQEHPNPRMRYKLIQSRISDKNEVFRDLYTEAFALDQARYEALDRMVLGSNIPQLQESIAAGSLTYEELTRYYLRRIFTYELDSTRTLHAIVALNPQVVEQARARDYVLQQLPGEERHPIFGMPILLKDNIGTEGMPTTAGAAALSEHQPENAFITSRLKMNGALILGKVNLSEWAYFFCGSCPVGYSAVGGQTLNPYGRGVFETGGSSSGSGAAVAAGYAVAAVGTETSGSILSPSGKNSVVGLKPTIGLLSRTGIVPISQTLDTPGPMARNTMNAGILLDAMRGYDPSDARSSQLLPPVDTYIPLEVSLQGRRLGFYTAFAQRDSLYRNAIETLRDAGAEMLPLELPEIRLTGMLRFLTAEMKLDLARYLSGYPELGFEGAADIVAFNQEDSLLRAPYGQVRFEGILSDTTTQSGLDSLRLALRETGRAFFKEALYDKKVEAVLSVDNWQAGLAATAQYPALGVPMGFRPDGEPANLTWISRPYTEKKLLNLGRAFAGLGSWTRPPAGYGF